MLARLQSDGYGYMDVLTETKELVQTLMEDIKKLGKKVSKGCNKVGLDMFAKWLRWD